MEITWLGHSCFKIKGKEVTLVTDPYDDSIGYTLTKPAANIVTLSHNHPGHSYVASVEGSPKVLHKPGEYEVSNVFIIGIATYHDSEQGKIRGKNTVYLVEMDEVKLCHLGDLGHILSPHQIEELGSVEVLFIPVGGISTVGAKTAAGIVRLLNPKVVIPMHYNTKVVSWLEPVDKFLKEMGLKEVVPRPKVSLTRSNLPLETQVMLLNYPA